jgi:hypothetical protein
MSGAIPPFPQYAFMAWCLVKAQGQLYLFKVDIQCSNSPQSIHSQQDYINITFENAVFQNSFVCLIS